MTKSMRYLVILCILLPVKLLAQDNGNLIGKIKGRLIKEDSSPVQFGTISLILVSDSSKIATAVSTENGNFTIYALPNTSYCLFVEAIGFEDTSLSQILIKSSNEVDLGDIPLKSKHIKLEEVKIISEKKRLELIPGGYVFNPDNTIIGKNGNIKDLLKQIPGVWIDASGNILLRGNRQVNVMIDGKPVLLSSRELSVFLQQLNASNVSKVIILTSPSAKYDAQGTAGIIDIKTKQSGPKGFFGTISGGLSTHDKNNQHLNLSYNKTKVNVYANLGLSHSNYWSNSDFYFLNSDGSSNIQSNNTDNSPGNNFNSQIGINYFINQNNTIGGTIRLNNSKRINPNELETNYFDKDGNYERKSIVNEKRNTQSERLFYDFNHRKAFGKTGKELVSDFNYTSYSRPNTAVFERNQFDSELEEVSAEKDKRNIENKVKIYSFRSDYSNKFNDNSKLEAGVKFDYSVTSNDFTRQSYNFSNQAYITNERLSNTFEYKEKIAAAYFSYSSIIKTIEVLAGIRTEYSNIYHLSKSLNQNYEHENQYIGLFPSLSVSKNFEKDQAISLNINRRINRPRYSSLNPFINNSNPNYLTSGNPSLKPSYSNNIEVTYKKDFEKSSIVPSISFTRFRNLDDEATFPFPDSSNVFINIPINLDKSSQLGINMDLQNKLTSFWEMNSSLNLSKLFLSKMYTIQTDDYFTEITTPHTFWVFSINTSSAIKLPKDFIYQINAYYTSTQVGGQIKNFGSGSCDMGIQKGFFNNKLKINFEVSDVFNTLRFRSILHQDYLYSSTHSKFETRIGSLSLSWRFGKKEKTKAKRYAPEQSQRVDD